MISDRLLKVEELRETIRCFMEFSYRMEDQEKAFDLIKSMKNFDLEFLPYAAITEVVYRQHIQNMKSKDDMAHEKLDIFLTYYSRSLKRFKSENSCLKCSMTSKKECDECVRAYKVALKIYEHLELAQQQLDSLFSTHEQKISEIEDAISEVRNLQQENQALASRLENLESDMKASTSSYISILGIFAAILLGAFGAMQGFTSLFNNIDKTTIGNLIIISGLSGLVVISILCVLIFSLAKLTEKSLRSESISSRAFFQYPLISGTFIGLLMILTIGVAIELSTNVDGYVFWIVPVILCVVLVYLFFVERR